MTKETDDDMPEDFEDIIEIDWMNDSSGDEEIAPDFFDCIDEDDFADFYMTLWGPEHFWIRWIDLATGESIEHGVLE